MSVYRNIHVLFSGFTQRRDHLGNGIPVLADKLRKQTDGQNTLVEVFPWYTSGIAAYIHQRCDEDTRVHLVGYSYGGQTAADVARELIEYRTPKRLYLTLSDAVARRSRMPWGWAASVVPPNDFWPRIQVPEKAVVRSYIQRQKWPVGHRLATRRVEQILAHVPHTQMDGLEEFHQYVLEIAGDMNLFYEGAA